MPEEAEGFKVEVKSEVKCYGKDGILWSSGEFSNKTYGLVDEARMNALSGALGKDIIAAVLKVYADFSKDKYGQEQNKKESLDNTSKTQQKPQIMNQRTYT